MSGDTGWVVVAMDDPAMQEIEHSVILKYNHGEFEIVCLKMFRTKYVAWLRDFNEAVFVGDNGECAVVGSGGGDRDEYVTTSDKSPRNTGHIRSATTIGNDVIVVGMQRQVYRRVGGKGWVDMMEGIPPLDPDRVAGFECVLAVSNDEIYAAGWDGEIWLFDGDRWTQVDSPTNRIITSLCLNEEGDVIGCGRNGMIIKGRRDTWRVVDDIECPDDLWSVESYSGTVYASALRFMYALSDSGLGEVEFGSLELGSFGLLVSGGGVLWSIGEKDLASFDGKTWSRLG